MVTLDFPRLRQSHNYDCGAIVTQAVLEYYGFDVREDKIMKMEKTNKNGTNPKKILNTLKKYKLRPKIHQFTIGQVKKFISNGHPVILLVQAWTEKKKVDWEKDWSDGHYVVAIGYDKNKMYFEDPSSVLKTYLNFGELEKRWHDTDGSSRKKGKKYVHCGIVVSGKKKYDSKKSMNMG